MGDCSSTLTITTTRARRAYSSDSPVALGVRGGALEVNDLRIYRDIYYTSALANTPRHSQGMATDVKLGRDEYFVLGDNSPVSNDSRFWNEGPVVRGSMFVGRPFLVHQPGQVIALNVFGRSVCWVPDPRRIRYIPDERGRYSPRNGLANPSTFVWPGGLEPLPGRPADGKFRSWPAREEVS